MTTQKPRVIHIPESHKLPFPSSKCPLKLFAYHIAIRRGCDVGQPGNLAKSVTVE
jgi:glucosamine--fructose-6-phosphate aminotransferase (isomerizing)